MPDPAPVYEPALERPSGDDTSSALVRLARSAWLGAAAGWDGSRPAARKRFGLLLLLATAFAAAAAAGSALLLEGRAVDGLLPGDASLTDWSRGAMSIHSAIWLGAFTSSAMVTPLLVLAAVLWARNGHWERATTSVAAYIASKAIIFAGWNTWNRSRPADVAGGELVPADLSSFPSGHAVQLGTVYGLLVLWWAASTDRWWERALAWGLLLGGSLVLGVSRVRIGAHHPSDIWGGLVLGGVWLAGVAWAERAVRPARAVRNDPNAGRARHA